MFLLELLDGLYSLYQIFIAAPLAVVRWIRRLRHPTATELAVSATPEMQDFRRHAWLAGRGWLAVSILIGIAAGSFWIGVAATVLGLMFLPGMIEKRYDRLVARLSATG